MAEEEFIVLYTGQKTKKAKTWHDGTLKILAIGTKAVLYDDKQSRLDTLFVRAADVLLGEQIESDRYLILIEDKKSNNPTSTDPVQSAPIVPRPCVGQSVSGVRCWIAATRGGGGGLKRKRTGFVPPRMMKVMDEDKMPSPGTLCRPLSEADHTNLSPLQGMTSYKASIMKLYSRNKDSQNPVREVPEVPSSNSSLFVRSHPGNDDSDVSPQLTSFMSRLKNSGSSSQESNHSGHSGNREKRNPWTTFGPLKSDSGSQGSQSSEEGTQHVSCGPTAPTASTIKDHYNTDVVSKSKNDAREAISVLTTGLHHSEKQQQMSLQSTTVTKRTTNQIMALLRGHSSSNNSKLTNGEHEINPETSESLLLTEQTRHDEPVENLYRTSEKDCPETNQAIISEETEVYSEGMTMNTGLLDHPNHIDYSEEQDVPCHLTDSDPKDIDDSEEQDPFETSDATFDINFSPLSHVSSSEDEIETEKKENISCEQGNSVEAPDDTNGQTKSKDNFCLDSAVGLDDTVFCDDDSLTVGMRTGSLRQCVIKNDKLVEKNPNNETNLRSNCAPDSDFQASRNCEPEIEIKQINQTGANEMMCEIENVLKEENPSDIQKESDMIDQCVQPSPDGRSVNHNKKKVGSGNSLSHCLSSRTAPSNSHLLKDLQFSPDSFDLNCSLSQLSQSGFLGTLNAASNKSRNLSFPDKSLVTGSAFDDKPSGMFTTQDFNVTSNTSYSLANQHRKMFNKSSILDSSCPQKTSECVKMENTSIDKSGCQRVVQSSDLCLQTEGDCRISEEVVNIFDKRSVKYMSDVDMSSNWNKCQSVDTKEAQMNRCDVVHDKESKSIFHGKETRQDTNQNCELLGKFSRTDFSDSPEIPSEVFMETERTEKVHYGFTSSSESCMIAVVPVTDACNIKQNELHVFESDFMDAETSFPLPDAPDFISKSKLSSGNAAETENVSYHYSFDDSQPKMFGNDHTQFHSSTQREYVTSDSMISVPDLPGNKIGFQSSEMDERQRTCSLRPGENVQKWNPWLRRVSPSDVTGQVDRIQKHENEKYFTAEDVIVQDEEPLAMTVLTLSHPSRLCGDSQVKNSQAVPEEKKNISQMAAEHLEGYTVKGMRSGSVARRQTTHQPSLEAYQGRVKITAPYGRASRVTSSQLQQALDTVIPADNQEMTDDQSVVFVENLNTQLRLQREQSYEGLPQEKFNLKVSRVPVVEHVPSRDHISHYERFIHCRDGTGSIPSPLTPVLSGGPSDDHWLVHDSQSSTSTTEPVPTSSYLPNIRVHSKSEPAQQLHADSLSQGDSEENFYVDWNEGKPKFVSKPCLLAQQYKQVQESPEYQNVPLSPCVSSASSQSDFSLHDVHTVPQDGGKTIQDCPKERREKQTIQDSNFRQSRRPLRTNPVEEMRQEGYDVYIESSGDGLSVNLQSGSCVRVNKNVTNTNPHHKELVCNENNNNEMMTGTSRAPRLRPPYINPDLHSGRDRMESQQIGSRCFRYTGSARWEQSRLGHQEVVEEQEQEEKESRWGRYLQQQEEDVSATWQQGCLGHQVIEEGGKEKEESMLGRYVKQQDQDVLAKWQQSRLGHREVIDEKNQEKEESRWRRYVQQRDDVSQMDRKCDAVIGPDTTQVTLAGRRDIIQSAIDINYSVYQSDEVRNSTSHQGLDSNCDNFFGSVPKDDSSSFLREKNIPAVYNDSPAFDFDDSFDEAFVDTEEHSKLLKPPGTSDTLAKQTFMPSGSRLHEHDTPLIDVAKSPDLFPTQEKPTDSFSSKFTLPRFIHAPQGEKSQPQGRNPAPPPAMGFGRSSKFKTPTVTFFSNSVLQGTQRSLCGELQFPSQVEVEANVSPVRQVSIPVRFQNVQMYKQIISAALKEHLNILLFDLSKVYHSGLVKVDVSQYWGVAGSASKCSKSTNPACKCGVPSKMIQVRKDGPNKGRFFYACEAPRNQQCKFFQWMDQPGSTSNRKDGGSSVNRATLNSADSITAYVRGHGVTFYCECQYLLKYRDNYSRPFRKGIPAWVRQKQEENKKKCMYVKLSRKDASSFFAKDDLWVVSQTLMFEPRTTFIARSAYFGPNSNNEVEIEPLAGYSPSNWTNNVECHAVLAGNASTELTCLVNLEEHVHPLSLPILPHLLDKASSDMQGKVNTKLFTPGHFVVGLAETYVIRYKLNEDQCEAVMRVANMMNKDIDSTDPVLLIHGVFGAGKSFLLSVLIRFLVEIFEKNDSYTPDVPYPWKLLISSTTNVAVDRVLMGLLDLGFEDFIRVGSVKKIAKQVLPYSVHASGSDSQELKDLQQMLRSDIPPSEKQLVRRGIEKHRLGENKKKLGGVRVVGVTCAACSFNCLNKIHFPFVVLDECSQMTEPASMLPIARFCCEKLVLVGDPKQLDPTIQGSEAGHSEGLEQTLFDRMIKLDYSPVLLRTQYRCHPWISCITNTLFYNGQLQDGVTLENRAPLTPMFPTLSFYDVVTGEEQTDGSGSYYNVAEAQLVVLLIQGLVVEGVDAGSIGVITLYKAQMYKIITSLHTEHPSMNKELKRIQVSTVDAFQGGERDVIILSCVRTNNFGFIDNDKRTNVALTRARHHLLITGHQRNLVRNKLWSQVIKHCRARPQGVQNSATVTAELHRLVEEKMSQTSEASLSQEGAPVSGQGKKKRSGKRKRVKKEEDSPPMSLSGQDTENSGDSIKTITPPDVRTDDGDRSVSVQEDHVEDELDAEDFVLLESTVNIPQKGGKQVRKRQRLSHLLDPDVFMDIHQQSSDEELPTFI